MNPTIAVAMSGGVDSLVAASLLRDKGLPLFGVHFLTGYNTREQCSRLEKATRRIGIPLHVADFTAAFQELVVDPYVQAYQRGRTPNPCALCNRAMKFGVLSQYARVLGADMLATGHYARLCRDEDGRVHLLRGIDTRKDQSYFLAFLTQEQLSRACFPLGGRTKKSVLQLAQREGLLDLASKESQESCFVRERHYGDFLAKQRGFSIEPGPIVDLTGRHLGTHPGLHRFTVGQRRGINCPARKAYYVVRIEPQGRRLIVGHREHLLSPSCEVTDINWIRDPDLSVMHVSVKIRYRHRNVSCTVVPRNRRGALVHFKTPQSAVTPGQAAVFYSEEEVVGGGWIR
ncbi:tRNA 2-thiouridine(34) synthase MnmA [Thermodesulfobacteriota bacterium]